MKRTRTLLIAALVLLAVGFTGCKCDQPKHEAWTQELINALDMTAIRNKRIDVLAPLEKALGVVML